MSHYLSILDLESIKGAGFPVAHPSETESETERLLKIANFFCDKTKELTAENERLAKDRSRLREMVRMLAFWMASDAKELGRYVALVPVKANLERRADQGYALLEEIPE